MTKQAQNKQPASSKISDKSFFRALWVTHDNLIYYRINLELRLIFNASCCNFFSFFFIKMFNAYNFVFVYQWVRRGPEKGRNMEEKEKQTIRLMTQSKPWLKWQVGIFS